MEKCRIEGGGGGSVGGRPARLVDLLHAAALVDIPLERGHVLLLLLEVVLVDGEAELDHAVDAPATVLGSSREKPEVRSADSKRRSTRSFTVLSLLSASARLRSSSMTELSGLISMVFPM